MTEQIIEKIREEIAAVGKPNEDINRGYIQGLQQALKIIVRGQRNEKGNH